MDDINTSYGQGILRIAAEGYEKNWIMKLEFLSKQYTTDWRDIMVTK
jgi:DNA polymerase V